MPLAENTIDKCHEIGEYLAKTPEERNRLKRCPVCNSNIEDRVVSLYRGLIRTLYDVYCWLGEHKRHEFNIKDVKHLMGKNEYARFGDLVRFGGLVYKPKDESGKSHKGEFGINMARAKEFFAGERKIPMYVVLNQITNEIIESEYISVSEFQELSSYIDENGLYDYTMKIQAPLIL